MLNAYFKQLLSEYSIITAHNLDSIADSTGTVLTRQKKPSATLSKIVCR